MMCGTLRAVVTGLIVTNLSAGCLSPRPQTYEPTAALAQPEGDAPSKLELPTRKGAEACLATAQVMDKNGQAPEAVGYYEKARSMNPEYTHVCRRLAVLYDKYGNFTKADEEYEKALALFPKDPALLNDVGNCHRVRGNWRGRPGRRRSGGCTSSGGSGAVGRSGYCSLFVLIHRQESTAPRSCWVFSPGL